MDEYKEAFEDKALIAVEKNDVPEELPILPVRDQVVFPKLHTSLAIKMDSADLLESVLRSDRLMGVVGVPNNHSDLPMSKQVLKIGTVVRMTYVTRAPEDTTVIVAEGLKRFKIAQWLSENPFLKARIVLAPEVTDGDLETEALHRNLRELCKAVFSLSMTAPSEAVEGLSNIHDPLHLAYVAAAYLA
jgi:ATP-dependent Lon protease